MNRNRAILILVILSCLAIRYGGGLVHRKVFKAQEAHAEGASRANAATDQLAPKLPLANNEIAKSADTALPEQAKPGDAKQAEEDGTWYRPQEKMCWQDNSGQLAVVRYLKTFADLKFVPKEEPFNQKNQQDLDQVDYDTANGEKVIQWKDAGRLLVESIVFPDHRVLVRRFHPNGMESEVVLTEADGSERVLKISEAGEINGMYITDQTNENFFRFGRDGCVDEAFHRRVPSQASHQQQAQGNSSN